MCTTGHLVKSQPRTFHYSLLSLLSVYTCVHGVNQSWGLALSAAAVQVMTPTSDEQEVLLLSARYGEIDDVKAFTDKYGATALADARDESGNTILHMTCANGHEGTSASKGVALA